MTRRSVGIGALVAAGLCLAALGCGGGSQPAAGGAPGVAWERDLPSALTRAGTEKKLVMVDFYTDWCGWCRRLDQTTLADGNVRRALESVVTVRLNAEKDGRQEAERFNVDGFPTLLFLNASGSEVGRIPGYLEAGPFLSELQNIIKKA